MQQLTDEGGRKVTELAQRYGVSNDAVLCMLQAVLNGGGTMAQFYHNELGGGGQWMRGGMTMVGDMFNSSLKNKVEGLCSELSQLLSTNPFVPLPALNNPPQFQGTSSQFQGGQPQQSGFGGSNFFASGSSGGWWPSDLGSPNSSGGQNNTRYAYFANARRLAVEMNGHVTVYDTLNHQIGGVSQQQSGNSSLSFSSQFGTIWASDLPIISIDGTPQNSNTQTSPNKFTAQSPNMDRVQTDQETDIFAKIERLAGLMDRGMISKEEFATKKSELLSRM